VAVAVQIGEMADIKMALENVRPGARERKISWGQSNRRLDRDAEGSSRGAKGAEIETPKALRGRGMGRVFPSPSD